MASFEKLKSDWNQTWFMDTIWDPLFVHAVEGHVPRLKGHRGQDLPKMKNSPNFNRS